MLLINDILTDENKTISIGDFNKNVLKISLVKEHYLIKVI